MSRKKAALASHWVDFYDETVGDAAKIDGGAYLILGLLDGIMQSNDNGDRADADTLAHIRYVLQQYDKAFKATLPQEEG